VDAGGDVGDEAFAQGLVAVVVDVGGDAGGGEGGDGGEAPGRKIRFAANHIIDIWPEDVIDLGARTTDRTVGELPPGGVGGTAEI